VEVPLGLVEPAVPPALVEREGVTVTYLIATTLYLLLVGLIAACCGINALHSRPYARCPDELPD
jgi:hypothetical protein